jgi:hypothetical protein
VSVCPYVFQEKLYTLLVSASLLRFLIIATTIETHVSMVDEHNVSLELLVGNSLNQADPGNAGFESRLSVYKFNTYSR